MSGAAQGARDDVSRCVERGHAHERAVASGAIRSRPHASAFRR